MSRPSFTDDEALAFHAGSKPGKLEVVPTKPMATQRDLSLAYSPGVAVPVLRIAENPALAYDYTAKGNMVAVISNGTAILGLGDLGQLASKPVMEGKAVLFKRFADVNSFDLCIDTKNVDEFIAAVRYLGPSFGGINLEDIKAPECFEVEEQLKRRMRIPVFHDDQHGTAIIVAAAILNGLELAGKAIGEVRIVTSGAGAAALAFLNLLSIPPRPAVPAHVQVRLTLPRGGADPVTPAFSPVDPRLTVSAGEIGFELAEELTVLPLELRAWRKLPQTLDGVTGTEGVAQLLADHLGATPGLAPYRAEPMPLPEGGVLPPSASTASAVDGALWLCLLGTEDAVKVLDTAGPVIALQRLRRRIAGFTLNLGVRTDDACLNSC